MFYNLIGLGKVNEGVSGQNPKTPANPSNFRMDISRVRALMSREMPY